jgi:carboxypeptidase family protein
MSRIRNGAFLSAAVVLVLCFGLALQVQGQTFTASLLGTVTDPTGSVVPGARISLLNEATNVKQQEKVTDARGAYLFTLLPPGSYRMTVEMTGFQTSVRTGLILQVQQQAEVNVTLSVGDVSTSVAVEGETPRLDTVSATLGRVVENRSLQSMPLTSRSILDLANLTPGVVGSPAGTGSNFVSNGVRNSTTDMLVDGTTVALHEQGGGATDIKFRPTVELVQEFKVQTNSLSAEYGFTGGTVISAVTKSGTNQLHGSAFDYLRNSALNANDFFSNRAGRTIVPSRQNQFGGSIGGPVYLPRIYDGRNKTFFFFHHEGTKTANQTTSTQTLPTALEKAGDFSQTMDANGRVIQIFDPYNVSSASGAPLRAAFPGNVIPSSRFNPVAAAAIKFYPDPNQPGLPFTRLSNYFFSGSRSSNGFQQTSKIDHNFDEKQRISFRASLVRQNSKNPNTWGEGNWMSANGNWNTTNTNNPSVDYTRTISPTLVLSMRWGWARQFGYSSLPCEPNCNFNPATLNIQGPWTAPIPPQFGPEAYQTVGTGRFTQIIRGEDVNHFNGNVTKIFGPHTMKFGAEARLYRLNYAQPGVDHVVFSFPRTITMQSPTVSNSGQGNGLASMLLGWGTGDNAGDAPSSLAYQSYAFFYQHDWQLTSKFTVNFGVRYELPVPETERYNRESWFDPLVKSPLVVPAYPNLRGGIQFALNGNDYRSPYWVDKNNWAPRISFAWQFLPKMVMRSGFGIYYGLTRAQVSSPLGPGFRTGTSWTPSLDGNVTQYASLTNPFKDGINTPPGSKNGLLTNVGVGTGLSPIRDWHTTPYYPTWSFSIERELPGNAVMEVAYSGSRGIHLGFDTMTAQNRIDQSFYSFGARLNDLVPNPFFGIITDPLATTLNKPTVTLRQTLLPYPQFTSVGAWPAPPIADSVYNAVQVKYTKRYSHGFNVSAHYTMSKMIDDNSLSSSGQSWLGGQTPIQTYSNVRLERGVSARDITHRGVMDFLYELPIGKGKAIGQHWSRPLDMALGGWQVNSIFVLQSGIPLVPNLQSGVLPDATQRPNLLFEPGLPGSVQSRLDRYLDPNAFSRPASYVFGNAPRTLPRARGPGLKNWDASIFKNVNISPEGTVFLQLRGEAFNVTNTPIFSDPNVTFGSTSFGVISGTQNNPRVLQIALKLNF